MESKHASVCLVSMPYAALHVPSLALGLLHSYIVPYRYTVEVIYGNLFFAERLGLKQYQRILTADHESMVGEWTFAPLVFPEEVFDEEEFFSQLSLITDRQRKAARKARKAASRLVEALAVHILEKQPKVVGCSSMFQQNCPSLALLKTLKAMAPELITVMGGSNCEGVMGQAMVEQFPFLDYVFSGEADEAIGPFVDSLLQSKVEGLPQGVLTASTSQEYSSFKPRATVTDMGKVAQPNYTDYFQTLQATGLQGVIVPGLLVETSRGCWWGAKKHCTFCGLNGLGMAFRAREANCVIESWKTMAATYATYKFQVVDNILPLEYMETLLPKLEELGAPFEIFYETKANLKREQLGLLARAGVRWIQPGIESLHDGFLKIIEKGTHAMQSVAVLKWARESGVYVFWNLLYGAPGEEENWYEEMIAWFPMIVHLQPPQRTLPISFHRYSPYFDQAEQFGLSLVPAPSYRHVYRIPEDQVASLAYAFKDASAKASTTGGADAHNNILTSTDNWRRSWKNTDSPPLLYMTDYGEAIDLWDTRAVATASHHRLIGLEATVYRMCEAPLLKTQLLRRLEARGVAVDSAGLEYALQCLTTKRLLLYLSHRYLALALKEPPPCLPARSEFPGGFIDMAKYREKTLK